MNKPIKKIILREILVILTFVLAIIGTSLIPNIVVLKDEDRPINLLTEERIRFYDQATGRTYTAIVKKHEKGTSSKFDLDTAVPIKDGAVKIEKHCYRLKDELYGLCIAFYLLYLLIRSTVWLNKEREAIKALIVRMRKKPFFIGATISFALSFIVRQFYIQFLVLAVALFVFEIKKKNNRDKE